MIYIFQVENNTRDITEYIIKHLMVVCGDIQSEDAEAVAYLEILYYRVTEDARIKPEERSLMHMLEKLEEDLMYDRSIFGDRAEFILDFLEADLLRSALIRPHIEEETKALGRIRILKLKYLNKDQEKKETDRLTPYKMKQYIDQYVIGQDAAKKAVCLAAYRHNKMVKHPEERFASNIVLLIGPSGCGKTEIMRRLQEITECPMVCTDVSSLGASQYRGRHKEDILISLWENAGRRKAEAEQGIIFMDEFDKILLPAISERGINIHDDVQSQLLTMLEGSDVELKVNGRVFTMNTSRILFVLAGAFQGIEECIRENKTDKGRESGFIGYSNPLKKEMDLNYNRDNINHDVLMRYGMKRELAGRISSIAVLEALGKEDLIRILTVPKDSMTERYAREIRLSCGAELEFTREALEKIADLAIEEKIGARALNRLVRQIVRRCLYEAPGLKGISKILITEDTIDGGGVPVYMSDSDESDWNVGEWNEETL